MDLYIAFSEPYRTIRLVGSNQPRKGRVEVYHNSQWGTVCDDEWDTDDATVVCRHLGHVTVAAAGLSSAHFGEGSGPIWLDGVACTGSESDLTECGHRGWGYHNCVHSKDAGVVCDGK